MLLDLGLPDRDGLELIGPFRNKGVPIVVLTAREGSSEKVNALDLGADDYVTKPFDSEELLARIRSLLRRADRSAGVTRRIAVGPVEIDLDAHSARKSGAEAKLTPKEFAVLAEVASHPGKVLTHTHLLREVWGPAHIHHVEYLRVTVRSLRAARRVGGPTPHETFSGASHPVMRSVSGRDVVVRTASNAKIEFTLRSLTLAVSAS